MLLRAPGVILHASSQCAQHQAPRHVCCAPDPGSTPHTAILLSSTPAFPSVDAEKIWLLPAGKVFLEDTQTRGQEPFWGRTVGMGDPLTESKPYTSALRHQIGKILSFYKKMPRNPLASRWVGILHLPQNARRLWLASATAMFNALSKPTSPMV